MRKFSVYIILFFLFIETSQAQYFPIFSQYLYNKLILNPAYAGADGVLSIDLFHRNQWIGLQGAPLYQSFVTHTPLPNQKAGIGITFLNQNYGIMRQKQFYLNYAYKIVSGERNLSIGLRGGIHYQNANWNNVNTIDPDPAFMAAAQSSLLPNFGLGIYYFTKQYFIGFSIPYLLAFSSSETNTQRVGFSPINNTYLINWGINIRSTNFKLTPSMLLKYNAVIGEQIDLNLMVYLFNDKLGVGNSVRLHDAYSLLMDYQINPQLRTGVCYDFPVSKLSRFSNGSFEIVIRYVFNYKIQTPDPRYF